MVPVLMVPSVPRTLTLKVVLLNNSKLIVEFEVGSDVAPRPTVAIPETFRLLEILTFPTTSSFATGLMVPMPVLSVVGST